MVEVGTEQSVVADTFAGRVHMEWEAGERAAVTPLGQLPYFVEFLHPWGLWQRRLDECPLRYTSPNAPGKQDVLGTWLLSVLSGPVRPGQGAAQRRRQP